MSGSYAYNAAGISSIDRLFVMQVWEFLLSPRRERSKGDVASAPDSGVIQPGGGILFAAAHALTADYLTYQHEHPVQLLIAS